MTIQNLITQLNVFKLYSVEVNSVDFMWVVKRGEPNVAKINFKSSTIASYNYFYIYVTCIMFSLCQDSPFY